MKTIARSFLAGMTLACPAAALAVGHVQMVTYDPTPGQPGSGDECTITFQAPEDTAVSRADVTNLRAGFERAMVNSDDMVRKVADACAKHGRMLTVNVLRDDPRVYGGETPRDGTMSLDLGDLEDFPNDMNGPPPLLQQFARDYPIGALAHEIDHNRHTPTEFHRDPPPAMRARGVRGPAVDDEDHVLDDLGTRIFRNEYTYTDPNSGETRIDFTIDGHRVTFHLSRNMDVRGV